MKVRSILLDLKRLLGTASDRLTDLAVILLTIFLISFTVITLSLSVTYVALAAGTAPPPFHREVADQVLLLLLPHLQTNDPQTYFESLSFMLNAGFIIVTVLFSIAPIAAIIKFRKDVAKRSNIRAHRIYTDGVDDLQVMYRRFRGAEEVIVHSGDFSWINRDQQIGKEIISLAQQRKLKLISYKTLEEVRGGIGDDTLFDELVNCLQFQNLNRIKCSFVRRLGINVFLYKVETMVEGVSSSYVFELVDAPETRYLLNILGKLIATA